MLIMPDIRHWRSQELGLQGARYNYDVDRAIQHVQKAEGLMQKGRIRCRSFPRIIVSLIRQPIRAGSITEQWCPLCLTQCKGCFHGTQVSPFVSVFYQSNR